MQRSTLLRKIPDHLACALVGAVVLGVACRRGDVSEQSAAKSAQTAPPETVVSPPPQPARSSPAPSAGPAEEAPPGDAPATLPAGKKRKYVVAALGDSITDQRVGGGGYLRYLATRCPKSRFDHYGRGGDMTNQMRRRLERDLLPRVAAGSYTHLIVYGGVNDLYSDLTAGRTNERIETDLVAIYDRANTAGLEVVAVTVSPWSGFTRYYNARRGENTKKLNDWILEQAEAGRIEHAVDSYPLLSCGDPERLCPDYETRSHDGLHPGEKGHELLGELLFDRVFSDCL